VNAHRSLLAAYPARLRRKHGAELIETLVEMAGPGGRPTRAERGRLVLDGLRERFRPPARRPLALVAAVLALLVGGALGAAAGSWLGSLGYAALPDATALGQRVLPNVGLAWTSDDYLHVAAQLPASASEADVRQAAEQTRQRLAAEGWQTGPLLTGDGSDGILANVHFAAETAGTRLDVYAYAETQLIDIAGWPRRPAAYVPLTVAGLLLGLVAGWLTGVALTHRIQAARHPRRSALLAAAGLVLIIPSAVGFAASLAQYLTVADPLGTGGLLHTQGFSFGPTIDLLRSLDIGEGWYLSPSDLQQLPIWGLALIAVAALIARPRRRHEAGLLTGPAT